MLTRRSFLAGSFAAALPFREDGPLVSLRDWLDADHGRRQTELSACLQRIKSADSTIRAWVEVLPQPVIGRGALADIPFGVKDIIETRGLSTAYGSPVYAGRRGSTNAAIVELLRRRGGLLLGKTHTTAFAYRDPAPTVNPRDPGHTPGGSSSGSAAAVAAGMVPFAIGTQTTGSVLRPASYCGVTGFKPTYGLLSTAGVLPYAPSFDTIGFFTHTASDMLSLWAAIGQPTGRDDNLVLGAPDPLPELEPEMTAALQKAVDTIRKAGVHVRSVDLSPMLVELANAQRVVAVYEGARVHKERFAKYGDQLGQVAVMTREGLQIDDARYSGAKALIAKARSQLIEWYASTPVMMVPAATGPAPKGLGYTGDPRMNGPWTAVGTPAISIPMAVGDALPLGLQLTAAPGDDARLLRTAVRISRILIASIGQ
jgi:Asp-tRNA(Asn)/Glu-tRNA(Gln) amidotransferase A subunit family amidase